MRHANGALIAPFSTSRNPDEGLPSNALTTYPLA
jgi:hypothetical protein